MECRPPCVPGPISHSCEMQTEPATCLPLCPLLSFPHRAPLLWHSGIHRNVQGDIHGLLSIGPIHQSASPPLPRGMFSLCLAPHSPAPFHGRVSLINNHSHLFMLLTFYLGNALPGATGSLQMVSWNLRSPQLITHCQLSPSKPVSMHYLAMLLAAHAASCLAAAESPWFLTNQ